MRWFKKQWQKYCLFRCLVAHTHCLAAILKTQSRKTLEVLGPQMFAKTHSFCGMLLCERQRRFAWVQRFEKPTCTRLKRSTESDFIHCRMQLCWTCLSDYVFETTFWVVKVWKIERQSTRKSQHISPLMRFPVLVAAGYVFQLTCFCFV